MSESTTTDQQLEAMRGELDKIDVQLLEALRARLQICERIGHHKKAYGVAMMQPHRIGIVQARAAQFAAANGISAPFLRKLYEVIITETCRIEDAIIDAKAP